MTADAPYVCAKGDITAMAAARLKVDCILSYADVFAVAAGQQWEAIMATGDPELEALQGTVRMEMLQRR